MRRHRRLAGPGAVLLAMCVLTLASACGLTGNGEAPAATPTAIPSTTSAVPPQEALRRYVQNRFQQSFVANCDDAVRQEDVGKRCARLRGERNGMLAFELGPTFSEYDQLIILKPAADDWTVVHLENRDPNQAPVPGVPWPIEVAADLIVAGAEPCLRVRERAGLQAPEVTCLDDGTLVTIGEGPVDIDDLEWWRLEGYGWAAGNWLRYPEDVPEVAPVTPEA
ncbi:MAG: hypothetical protein IIC25_08930 [Chloroflexi bacterium]|nr:hypothetical protein [Chloroflexota bacterium]